MTKLQKFLPLILSIVAIVGMIFGMRLQSSLEADGYIRKVTMANDVSINETLQHIKAKYYGELDTDELTDAVVEHMVDQLDGYSHYFRASSDTLYDRYIKGLYNGVGIEFAEYQDSFYISAIVADSPAEKAGVLPGDRIIEIEEVNIIAADLTRDSILSLSDLSEGDTLDLTIVSWDTQEEKEVDIPVSDVALSLVHDYILVGDEEISYVKIDRFYDGVFREFMDALDHQAHDSSAVDKLIIDLRDNPGGIVDETVKLLNQLITDKEKLLVQTVDNQGRTKEYKSNGRGFLKIDKIVVIVNEHSASASEILAGCLQDYDRAVVIGSNSYGKGVIQQNYQLSNKGSINLTVGAYVLPSGRMISQSPRQDTTYYTLKNNRALPLAGAGITPDIMIEKCRNPLRRTRVTDAIIANRLWTQTSIESYLRDHQELLLAQVYDGIPQDTCRGSSIGQLNWYIYQERAKEGSRMSLTFADEEIRRAAAILLSDEYQQVLTASD